MKKLIILALMALTTGIAAAQSIEVLNAYNYKKAGELDKAKMSIDKAINDAKTGIEAKTWLYRGDIYLAISTNDQFKSLAPDALEIAAEAYGKAQELDVKKRYEEEIATNKPQVISLLFNQGVKLYGEQKYPEAIRSFGAILKQNPNDTLSMFNTALCAERGNDTATARKSFERLIEMKYPEVEIYRSLASVHKKESDTVKALAVLEMGRAAFPDNVDLIIDELNIYLLKGKTAEITNKLELACQKDPSNKMLFFAMGTAYDKLRNFDKAKAAYERAIELDGTYFDAYYNLGAMWFNWGVETYNKTVNLPASKQTEFEEGTAKYKREFSAALPYLERANVIDPKDRNTLISLKEIYAKLGEFQKANEVKKKLEGK